MRRGQCTPPLPHPLPMTGRRLLAAVDLGSNSFRLLIGRVEQTPLGEQILPLDALKEPVRLALGLDARGALDTASRQRGVDALYRFGERLRSFSPDAVRAVGTNTLRVASNAWHFLASAEAALGFPIDVIAGHEEARLIYLGAAHALPADGQRRLVVDIGGGSTECMLGTDYAPALLESAQVGCVTLSERFFPGGRVDARSFERARFAARDALAPIGSACREHGWHYAVGPSGTAKALAQIAQQGLGAPGLTHDALTRLATLLVKAGHADRLRVDGLRADRRPVLAGGLALMCAVFDELEIAEMRYCPAALREGVLYDLLGRSAGADMREISVAQMRRRYAVDEAHSGRVAETALALYDQAARGVAERLREHRELLRWAAGLAEVGRSISHEDFHRHSAYILRNADMPGFTRAEQALMSRVALGQVGGLRKMRELIADDTEWLMVLCLRLSSILHRRRDGARVPLPALFLKRRKVRLELPEKWAREHPLSDATLSTEVAAWNELGVFEEIVYVRI